MYGNYSVTLGLDHSFREARSTNSSSKAQVFTTVIVLYDIEGLFAANPDLTQPGAAQETIRVSLLRWNTTDWVQGALVSTNVSDTSVSSHVLVELESQYSMFFSYPQQFGVFQFSDHHICLEDGTTKASVLVVRRFGFYGDVTVTWRAERLFGFHDNSLETGRLHFRHGQRSSSINISVVSLGHGLRRIVVSLVAVSGRGAISSERNTIPITILSTLVHGLVEFDEWRPFLLAQEDVGQVWFAIRRRCPNNVDTVTPMMIELQLSPLSGDVSDVLLPVNKVVMIGDAPVYAVVHVVNDTIPELDEQFAIDIVNVKNAEMGSNSRAILTVAKNDDPYGIVEFESASEQVLEKEGQVNLTILRMSGHFGSIDVLWTVLNMSANGGMNDIHLDLKEGSSDVVTFADNQSTATIVIRLVDAWIPEIREQFEVRLMEARNGSHLGEILSCTVTVTPTNDHRPSFVNSTALTIVNETDLLNEGPLLIWSASAMDPDLGINGRISYKFIGGNCSQLSLNETSGDIYLVTPVTVSRENMSCFVEIEAEDGGYFPLSETQMLTVHLNSTFRCLPGSHSSTGYKPCEDCPLDTYQPYYGHVTCTDCPYGLRTAKVGVTEVTSCKGKCDLMRLHKCSLTKRWLLFLEPCLVGEFSTFGGVRPCDPCPRGYFQDFTGSTNCTACPDNTTTVVAGSTNSSFCLGT